MPEQLQKRIDDAERLLQRNHNAPTVPVYDPSNMPQDAVVGQVAVGSDNSFNWFDGTWHTEAGTPSNAGDVPQDLIDGQIAIGTDSTFHWCLGGTWFTSSAIQTSTLGSVPQDLVTGQIAIGTDGSFHWYDGTDWQTFA